MSVTPLPVALDSRTFKQASSFARAGYESIVVQGEPGEAPATKLLFELVTVPARPTTPDGSGENVVAQAHPSPAVNVADVAAQTGDLDHPEQAQPVHVPDPSTVLGRLAIRAQVLPAGIRRPLGKIAEALWTLFFGWRNGMQRVFVVPLHIKHYFGVSRRAYRVMPPADLYYLHSFVHFPAVFMRCLRHRARFVYDAHDFYSILDSDGRPRPFRDRAIWKFYAAVERVCARFAADCVTVSDGVAGLQRERFGREFAVVRNAHDRRLDEDGLPSMRQQLGLDDVFLLVVVGNAKRGGMAIESAMQALLLLPDDVHLLFLGGGYESHVITANRLGLAARFHAPGRVAPAHVASAIRDADLAPILYWDATPNFRNCLPNGLFHALAAGLPILYPDLPEIRAVVEPAGNGLLVDPRDPAALANVIERFRSEPGLASQLGAAAIAASNDVLWEGEEPRLLGVVAPLLETAR